MASPSAYSKPAGVGPVVGHKATSSPRRVATATHLGAIEEDGGMRPDMPQRSLNRPVARFFHIPFQAREPPSYTEFNDVTGPRGEKFSDLRNNRHIAKRGGLIRVLLIALIVLLVIVGLAVGLGVGLTRSKGNSRYSMMVLIPEHVLTSIGTVRPCPLLLLRRQLHLFPLDRTALTHISRLFQQLVLRIQTPGDAFRTPPMAKRVLGQTPHSIGLLHPQRKTGRTISFPRPTTHLPSILIMQHLG